VLSRWASPFGRESRRAAGIRALKLTTIVAPLTVQLVDRAGKPHPRASQLNISASDIDFNAKATKDADITASSASGRTLVIRAREDVEVAREVRRVLSRQA